MKRLSLCLLVALAAALVMSPVARADIIEFTATLTGSQETPPNSSPAMGHGTFEYDSVMHSLTFDITYGINDGSPPLIGGTVSASHFHNGPPGVAGPVVHGVPIGPDPTGGELIGVWNATGPEPLTPALEAALLAGNIYFNIHTVPQFGGGEIRGQLTPQGPAVPEPSTWILLGTGFLGMLALRRRMV